MAKSVNELKDVLKETLEENGVLSQIRAKIRAEIFNTLNDNPVNKPELSNENLLINELIREYLTFNNYSHTLAVFLPESGQPHSAPFDRSYITKKLKLVEDKNSRELPLLYGSNITILGLTFGAKKLVNQDQPQGKPLHQDIFGIRGNIHEK